MEILGVRSGLLLPSGVSRGCGRCDLGDNTVPFRDLNDFFFFAMKALDAPSLSGRKAEPIVRRQTKP